MYLAIPSHPPPEDQLKWYECQVPLPMRPLGLGVMSQAVLGRNDPDARAWWGSRCETMLKRGSRWCAKQNISKKGKRAGQTNIGGRSINKGDMVCITIPSHLSP